MRQLLQRGAETTRSRTFVGVVHLRATPGAPGFDGSPESSVDRLVDAAVADAQALLQGGVDALIVENFGDAPFFAEHVPAETIATLARAVGAVRASVGSVPVGVNVLRNDVRSGLGICASTGASFVRVNVHVGAMLTDQGIIEGRAAETLRERARLCPEVVIAADVHVKHARPLVDQAIEEVARETAGRGGADVLIASGTRTGAPPARAELERIKEAVPGTPLWIGSGLDPENASELLAAADGAIVGTALKEDGRVFAPVDPGRVAAVRKAFDRDCR